MANRISLFGEKYLYPIVFLRDFLKSYSALQAEKKTKGTLKADELPKDFFSKKKKILDSDCFFILGGSRSINSITDEMWAYIERSTSIGINAFFVHPFVPSLLMVEGFRSRDVGSPLYQYYVDNLNLYLKNKSTTLLIKDPATSWLPWENIIVENRDTYLVPKFIVPGRTNDSVKKAMSLLKLVNFHKKHFLMSRASITLAMSIGYKMGFKKIVLLGVDLNDGLYFWETKDFVHNNKVKIPLSSGQPSKKIHSTVNPDVNMVTADKSILSFYENILKPEGVEVFIGSKSSRLYPELPLFDEFR